MCQRIAAFSSRVSGLGSRAWEDSEVEAALVEEGDELVAEARALGSMLAGQEEVHSKLPKVGKRSAGGQRERQTSPSICEAGTGDEGGTKDGKEHQGVT